MTRWIFAIALLGAALPAPGLAEDVGAACLHRCSLDEIVSVVQEGANGKHTLHGYELDVRCDRLNGQVSSPAGPFRVEAQYSPLTNLGTEKILQEGKVAVESSFRCNGDPFRGSGSCTETARRGNVVDNAYPVSWFLCPGVQTPLLRSGAAEINARVAAEMADPPGPVIVSPRDAAEVPHFGELRVEVEQPPREGWFANASFPETVQLNWQYLGPDGSENFQWHDVPIRELTGVGQQPVNALIDAYRLKEGRWKLSARFPGEDWSYVHFWVGDRVEPDLPAPTILIPAQGSQHASDPVEAQVDYENKSDVTSARRAELLRPDATNFETQWMSWDPEAMTWRWTDGGVYGEAPRAERFELWRAGEGKFRFRARHRRVEGGPGYPWSPWRTYYVGDLGEEIRTAERSGKLRVGARLDDPQGPGPGGSVGAEALEGGPRGGASFGRVPLVVAPMPGQQLTGDVVVKLQSGTGSPAVRLRIEVFEAGRWQELYGPMLPQPAPPGQPVQLARSLFGDAERARVRVVMPDGTSGVPTEFRLGRLTQLPTTPVPGPKAGKKVSSDVLSNPVPPPPGGKKLKGLPH